MLAGGVQTVARLKPILYVENDRQDKSPELVRYIDSLGYAMYWHVPPLFSLKNFFQNPENVFGDVVSLNMLCIHRDQPHDMQGFQRVEVPAADLT